MSPDHREALPANPTRLSDDHTWRRLDAGEAGSALHDWLVLYTRCFSTPPWNEPALDLTEYELQVGWHFEQPGFRALEARAAGGAVAAVAYGWPAGDTPPDRPYYWTLAEALGVDRVGQLWETRPFEVVELMVDPGVRGQGLARQLLRHLCPSDGVSTLATHTDAPAVAMYLHLGWRRIGSSNTNSRVPLDYFVLDPNQRLS